MGSGRREAGALGRRLPGRRLVGEDPYLRFLDP